MLAARGKDKEAETDPTRDGFADGAERSCQLSYSRRQVPNRRVGASEAGSGSLTLKEVRGHVR